MTAGDRIKNLRLARGYTLEELGILVGVGKSTVRKWETGAIANMRRDKIAKLAQALGTSPLYIIGGDDSCSITAYDIIRYLADRDGVSIEDMCEATGIPTSEIYDLMYKRTIPLPDHLANSISSYFHVSTDIFEPGVFEDSLPNGADLKLLADIQRKFAAFGSGISGKELLLTAIDSMSKDELLSAINIITEKLKEK